ncbi:MAG: hypothetical protein LBE07_02200 [Gordonia sp. (in: high G+C Gram-positive bacteria)]|jgi:uncharacterized glyoxalase superfamily protein PhnB|nr:hypothetical protein [Gordonia sp. (in: high G+C Gram-positive bacteria)]
MPQHRRQQSVYPNLRYKSPRAASDFLTSAFGFTPHFTVPSDDGDIEHAQILAGTDLIFLGRSHPNDRYRMSSPEALGGTTQAICIRVPDEDLDAHAEQAEASGATILNPIHDSLAGVREYTCADPEGHVWTFSSYSGE